MGEYFSTCCIQFCSVPCKKTVYIQGVIFIMKLDVRSEQRRGHIASVRSTTFGVGPKVLSFRQHTTVHNPQYQCEWVSRDYGMQC
jgi:hypothetical protein